MGTGTSFSSYPLCDSVIMTLWSLQKLVMDQEKKNSLDWCIYMVEKVVSHNFKVACIFFLSTYAYSWVHMFIGINESIKFK